jgi:hypothetical protein
MPNNRVRSPPKLPETWQPTIEKTHLISEALGVITFNPIDEKIVSAPLPAEVKVPVMRGSAFGMGRQRVTVAHSNVMPMRAFAQWPLSSD